MILTPRRVGVDAELEVQELLGRGIKGTPRASKRKTGRRWHRPCWLWLVAVCCFPHLLLLLGSFLFSTLPLLLVFLTSVSFYSSLPSYKSPTKEILWKIPEKGKVILNFKGSSVDTFKKRKGNYNSGVSGHLLTYKLRQGGERERERQGVWDYVMVVVDKRK